MTITSGVILETPWSDYSSGILGLVSAANLIGATVGAFCGGFVSDRIGPKKSLGLSFCICLLCAILLCVQKFIWFLIVLRVFSGLGVGCITSIAPLYIGEQSSSKYRGMFVSLFQVFITLGIIFAYLTNFGFSFFPSGSNAWRWEFLLTGVFAIIFLSGYFCIPESAGYLDNLERNRVSGDDYYEGKKKKKGLFGDIKEIIVAALSSKRAFLVGMIVAMFGQLTGINIIMMFSPSIIKSIGVSEQRLQLLGTIFIGIWNMITVFVAFFLVDVLGRKPLLLAGYCFMLVGNLLTALASFIDSLEGHRYFLSFPGLGLFVFGFEIGTGPIFYILVSEFYSVEVRGRAMGLMITINWLCNIIIVQSYLPLKEGVGDKWVFTVLTAFCLFIIVFVAIFVSETKGKALESRVLRVENEKRGYSPPIKVEESVSERLLDSSEETSGGN